MLISRFLLATTVLAIASASGHAGQEIRPNFRSDITREVEGRPAFKTELTKEVVPEKTKIDLVTLESDYVGQSHIHGNHGRGMQDVAYQSAEYGHRFLISGNWYFRTGFAYERYDFGKSNALVPGKLQSLRVPLAIEYVQDDFVGATIQIEPGFYFENELSGDNFDIPWEAYFTLKLKEDRLFAVLGASGAQYYSVPVVPVIGLIWLIDDAKKWRLEAVFPKASFVYNASEDWEFRVVGEVKGGGYRTDNNQIPKLNNAVVEYYEYRVGTQVTYSGIKPFDIVLGAGYALDRTFDYYRAEKSFKADPAPFVRLEVDAEF